MLKANRYRIGLYDLGAPRQNRGDYAAAAKRRTDKLKAKHRFTKNFMNKQQGKSTAITAVPTKHNTVNLFEWLAADRTFNQAKIDAAKLSDADQQDLAKWARTAFWRRTSKLGIDFTTGRGFTIHFNTAADRKWDPSNVKGFQKWRAADLGKIKNNHGRMITSSEFKHAKKGLKSGAIPANRLNFYDEF